MFNIRLKSTNHYGLENHRCPRTLCIMCIIIKCVRLTIIGNTAKLRNILEDIFN